MNEPVRTRSWTRKEYERLVEIGFFHEDESVELLGGQLIVAEPKGTAHSVAVILAAEALRRGLGAGWTIRVQDPIAPDDESEPEPDVSVVPGVPRDYLGGHPSRPVLVVEVAESSLIWDREQKGGLYARAGIVDYWIVNLVDRVLEVYRRPISDASAPFGWRYESMETLRPPRGIAPLANLDVQVAVADLLP